MSSIAVVIGGGPLAERRPPYGGPFDLVVAADSGFDHARAAGLHVDVLVGDLDSISEDGLRWATDQGVAVERHRPDKDDTDTALALRYAAATCHDDLVVLGSAATDRLDHQLGTIVALGDPTLAHFGRVTALLGETVVHVLHAGHSLRLETSLGDVFSLLALHGRCTGIDVTGARWPLQDAALAPGSTLGVSNEAASPVVSIRCGLGVLTVVRPPAASTVTSTVPSTVPGGPS